MMIMKVVLEGFCSVFGRLRGRLFKKNLQPIFHSELWKVFEALSIALESISGPKKGPSFASRERSKPLSRIPAAENSEKWFRKKASPPY